MWLEYNKTQNSAGIPFHYLLRDIAQYDETTDDSLNRIFNACVAPAVAMPPTPRRKRTCSIWIGLGSNYTNQVGVRDMRAGANRRSSAP